MPPYNAEASNMSDDRIEMTVELQAVTGRDDHFTSNALLLSGARIEKVLSTGNEMDRPFTVENGVVVVARDDATLPLRAVVSLPADLQAKVDDAAAMLSFDTAKLELEEKWKRRTFTWTIASAILTAVVAVTVALIGAGSGSKEPPGLTVASGPVQSCRDSLKRLATLADVSGQTLSTLGAAVKRHEETCDEVLVDVLAEIGK